MIAFQLMILLGVYDKVVESTVKETPFPNAVCGEFLQFSENKSQIPENMTAVFITDKVSLVRSALSLKKPNLKIIYCGYAVDAEKYLKHLEDVWPAGESTDVIRLRFKKLILNLRENYLVWFYQHTLLATINSVPDMIWYKRIDGIHMLVNDTFAEIVHKPKKAVLGKDHFTIWDVPRPAEGNAEFACAESEEIAIRTEKTYICDEPVKTRQGMKQFTTYKTPIYDMYHNVFGTVGVGHDVTNFNNLGMELSILMENLPFPMAIFSPEWKIVRMNSSFEKIFGKANFQSENFNYHDWKKQNLIAMNQITDNAQKHLKNQECKIIVGEETKYFMLCEQEIRDSFRNVSGYFCTLQDITYQRAYERSIIEAANTDMLTGMYNRRYFYYFLSQNADRPMTLLYMDLDRFKAVNDHYGHARGDEVLIKTAQMIQSLFPGTTSARLGGDEFALVMDGNNREFAENRSKHLEKIIRKTFADEGLDIAISIGIAETNGNVGDIDQFIHEGDTQMYAVKKQHHQENQKNKLK
ncbi:MAG: diguanylate cyclase [Oscillospiraceae bacterium]|nr:diguanylate cyclase [Oscillospiraceae bacterium]